MAGRILASSLLMGRSAAAVASAGRVQVSSAMMSTLPSKIGTREVVGFGHNGEDNYVDRVDFPMPAIRFKEETPDIKALREKERGDWKKLSIEEKKALYRASFRQTFAELQAPTGQWKSILGVALMVVSTGIFTYILVHAFVYEPLPITFQEEYRLAQLERMKILEVNPVTGLTSKK